jgi:hypothetical protein
MVSFSAAISGVARAAAGRFMRQSNAFHPNGDARRRKRFSGVI